MTLDLNPELLDLKFDRAFGYNVFYIHGWISVTAVHVSILVHCNCMCIQFAFCFPQTSDTLPLVFDSEMPAFGQLVFMCNFTNKIEYSDTGNKVLTINAPSVVKRPTAIFPFHFRQRLTPLIR